MVKKIFAFLLMTAMLLSMALLSSCDESKITETVNLTPKEKFLKTSNYATTYFNGLAKALGIDPSLAPVTEGKMESQSMSLTLNKFSLYGDDVIPAPLAVSAENIWDAKNNAYRILYLLKVGNDSLPVEMIVTAGVTYVGIDQVTDRMLKLPVDVSRPEVDENSVTQMAANFSEYINCFINSFGDDQFTSQTGKVTVDGQELDAETVTLNATEKQFLQAIINVLEKAKWYFAVDNTLSGFVEPPAEQDNSDLIDTIIEKLKEEAEKTSDNDKVTVTVISENNVLRSFDLTITANEKKSSISFTTTEKDGSHFIKGAVVLDEKKVIELNYQQKPNDKGSADGELTIDIDPTVFGNDESEDDVESVFGTLFTGNIQLSVKFNGEKKDNKFSVNTKLEISTSQSGMKVTIPLNMSFEFEKVSDTENKFSINFSANVMYSELDITVSGGKKIIDYKEVKAPADSEVDEFDEEKLEEIIGKIKEAYPGIAKVFSGYQEETE
jgi:hypothetical protein